MSNHVLENRSIKLAGLVTHAYCVRASISPTSTRAGTVWTNEDSTESTVVSKNHHRISDEESLISITTSSGVIEPSARTTAQEMLISISAEDRYETVNRVAYKEYARYNSDLLRSVVYGGAGLDTKALIDPYIYLSQQQFVLSARVNDVVKDSLAVRITEKRYTKQSNNVYHATVTTPSSSYTSKESFGNDDMFMTLAVGDVYLDEKGMWTVKEKRVFYLVSIGEIRFYGREILLVTNASL